MAKASNAVAWASNSVAAGGVRTVSNESVIVAAAYEGEAHCEVLTVSGTETGYDVEFYAQYRDSNTASFETNPPKSRMQRIGVINVDVTTMPLKSEPVYIKTLPYGCIIHAFSGATGDSVTVAVVLRTDAP